MDILWYHRLFYVLIVVFVFSFFLAYILKAKRMDAPEGRKIWMTIKMISMIIFIILLWFVPFKVNLAFWIGLGIIIFGQVIFALGFIAMQENPEKKQKVVDWGIYRISRHSHELGGIMTDLGVIVMGWNPDSLLYLILWIYLILDIAFSHFYILMEERRNVEKFGLEYQEYMKRTPRYFGLGKSV
jgi:protein-S-isoprenylcysteine O-methyltransferase Ste14